MRAIFILWCISELNVPFYTQDFPSLFTKLLRMMCAYGENDGFSEKWSELKQVFKNENNHRYKLCKTNLKVHFAYDMD